MDPIVNQLNKSIRRDLLPSLIRELAQAIRSRGLDPVARVASGREGPKGACVGKILEPLKVTILLAFKGEIRRLLSGHFGPVVNRQLAGLQPLRVPIS